jgi:hypothetical protein
VSASRTAWPSAEAYELASLIFDSASSATAARGLRSADSWRQLSFRASGLTLELSITETGPTRRLMGQLLPRQPATVDIRYGDTVLTIEADDLGRFTTDEVPAGQISIRCRLGAPGPANGETPPPIVTGWISI